MSIGYEMLPKGEPVELPTGLQTLYVTDGIGHGGEELTKDGLNKILQTIRRGEAMGVMLWEDADLEGDFFSIEMGCGLIVLQYVEDGGACIYSSFDPDYLESEEKSPIQASDGQSIILMRDTMHDLELAAQCVEYFARTGKLYPGMEWLKSLP